MLRSAWHTLQRTAVLVSASQRRSLREANQRIREARESGRPVVVVNLEHPDLLPFLLPLLEELVRVIPRVALFGTTRGVAPQTSLSLLGCFDARLTPWIRGARLYLTAQVRGVAPDGALKVLVPHNQPVRFSDYPRREFGSLDAILTMGPLHQEQSERTMVRYGLRDRPRLLEIGYPKSDALHRGAYSRDTVLQELGLSPDRPTLLYAPAWEEHLSLREFGAALFDALLGLTDRCNVIVKLHPASTRAPSHPEFQYFTGGRDWAALLRPYAAHANFRHLVTSDIDPLLAASDLMLTDMSSVALEFLALDRPVIYLDCPLFFDRTLPTIYREFGRQDMDSVLADPLVNAGRHVGLGIRSPMELGDAVNRFLSDPSLLEQERKTFSGRLLANRGRAAAAGARALADLLAGN